MQNLSFVAWNRVRPVASNLEPLIVEVGRGSTTEMLTQIYTEFSKIQLVVYCQCGVLIGWATTRLYVIAH